MKTHKTIGLTICLLAALVLCSTTAWAQTSAPASKPADVTDVAVAVKMSRQQFDDLAARMVEVAQLLAKTDPESSKAIQEAVRKAQAAFITENMKEVQDLLIQSLSKAHAKEQDVQKSLDEVLRILREGVDSRKNLQELKEMLKAVEALIQKQKDLEEQSSQDPQAASKEMADLVARLENIVKEQEALLKQTATAPAADGEVKKLADLRDAVEELIAKQDKLNDASLKAAISDRPAMGKAQETIAQQATALKGKLAEAAKDPKVAEALKKAEADKDALPNAIKSTEDAIGEMKKASTALGNSDAAKAADPQTQALTDLKDAKKALDAAIAKAGEKTPAGELAKKQSDLSAKTEQLGQDLKKTASKAGVDAKPENLAKAAAEMAKASDQLSGQNNPKAAEHQKQALEELKARKEELAQLQRKIAEKPKPPAAEQKKGQDDVSEGIKKTAEQMKGLAASTGEKTPGQEPMGEAGKSSSQASGSLDKSDTSEANKQQKEVLERLEKAKKELAEAIDKQENEKKEETLAQIDQLLTKMLEDQKPISATTKTVYAKRTGDKQYDRKEAQDLASLAEGEGRLAQDAGKVRKMLTDENATVVFPRMLQDVQEKLQEVQKNLAAKQADKLTQVTQAEIEQTLQQMIDAIREKLAEHRDKKTGGGGKGGGGGPLIPPVAELKMLLTMQRQINTRTAVLAEQADKIDKAQSQAEHKKLAEREGTVKTLADSIKGKMGPSAE